MNEEKSLSAQKRTSDFGSAGSRRLVRGGRIPAVIYGKNDPVHISLDAQEFMLKMRHFSETALLGVQVGKKTYECLMKDYQEDLLHGLIKHVDFYEVTRGHMLRTKVSVALEGNPVGVRSGGVLDQVIYEIEIECFPKDLPEELTLNVADLELNHSKAIRDIAIPAGVKVLDDLQKTVASVKSVKEEAAPVSAEEAAAPAETETAAPAEGDAATGTDKAKKMRLALGLGNPGAKYEHTRHNAGFDVVADCAAFFQVPLRKRCFRLYRRARITVNGCSCLLVQPLTFMNDSGAVAEDFLPIAMEDVIVVCDQLDLPVGTIRIRKGGGSAGHNGLKSLIDHFGSSDFIRVYVGIGRPAEGVTVVEHVLSRPDGPLFSQGVELAAKALRDLLAGKPLGEVESAYNRRNRTN